MNIVQDAYQTLIRARDALDAGPRGRPERVTLFQSYLRTRINQIGRAVMAQRPILAVPAMNRRFFVMTRYAEGWATPVALDPDDRHADSLAACGNGRGWAAARDLPTLTARIGIGMTGRHLPPIMRTASFPGTDILSRGLLDIWRRFDPAALDILPVRLTSRTGRALKGDYCLADVVRRLPALDLKAMNAFLFHNPESDGARTEIFPPPEAFALRDDLPVDGVHLFRDSVWSDHYFVSAELRQACLDAGFKTIPFARPETPDRVGPP